MESTLFWDPQGAKPIAFCQTCGGECYGPGGYCFRCERSAL